MTHPSKQLQTYICIFGSLSGRCYLSINAQSSMSTYEVRKSICLSTSKRVFDSRESVERHRTDAKYRAMFERRGKAETAFAFEES